MATSKRRKQTTGAPNPATAPEQAASPTPAEDMPAAQPAALAVNNTTSPAPTDEATLVSATVAAPASPAPENSAPSTFAMALPTTGVSGATPDLSPAAERAAFMRRRVLAAGGAVLLFAAAAFLGSRIFVSPSAPAPALADAATTTPAVLVATATPVPAAQVAPTAAPAPAAPAPAAGAACSAIANMPVYSGATCTKQDSDTDDGIVKREATYVSSATADEVRRFYEGAFAQNGWTLGNFKYDVNAGQRRVEVEVEADQSVNGPITKVQLTEHGAAAPARTSCAPIAGLPALPNATCTKFDTDRDDGVLKVENTYATTESPENIWRLFESALAQSGWAGQEFQYGLQQGQSQVEVKVEAQQGAAGGVTFKITEK